VRILLDHGADADVRQDMGFTPVQAAETRGHHEVARLLETGSEEILIQVPID
jgi:ankyrin repeat protein